MKIFQLVAIILVGISSYTVRSGLADPCVAQHYNGEFVIVRERQGVSPFWAHASWDFDGWPSITYGSTYFQLDPLMRKFTALHECAHLQEETTNEFFANCVALRKLRKFGLSKSDEDYIANIHQKLGYLPPQYGGSGAAFWQGTLEVCGE